MSLTTMTRRRSGAPVRPGVGVVLLLSGGLLLAACGGDAGTPEPTEAETGVPLLEGTADPAASPTGDTAP